MAYDEENGYVFDKSKRPAAPRGGYTKPDNTVRCGSQTCRVGQDESGAGIGTPLTTETISIMQKLEPAIKIARVTRCTRCFTLREVKILNNAASAYGFTAAGLCRLLKQSRGNSFSIEELRAGKLATVISPAELTKPVPIALERIVLTPNDQDALDTMEEQEAAGLPF